MEGWIAVKERFDDEGESGASRERPALQRLLEHVRAGDIDRVVVYRLDRLTRSVLDWAELIGALKRRGTQLSVVSGDLRLGELATSDLLLNLMAAFAEYERELIRDRLRDARAAHRRHGRRSAGRIPFGYRADALSHQLVIEPTEAAVVKDVFERAASGGPTASIALVMNTNIMNTKVGTVAARKGWTARSVLRLLANRTHLGEISGVPDRHEAIVSAELFGRARAAVAARRTRSPGRKGRSTTDLFVLRGLLHCARCQRKMSTSSSRALPDQGNRRWVADTRPRYYRCRGAQPCPGSQVSAQELEHRVLAWFHKPTEYVTPDARKVLGLVAREWGGYSRERRPAVLAQLVWEIRWDGPMNRFSVMLDETAIRETWLALEIQRARAREERRRSKQPPTSGRRRARRG
jgi:site-specific DNA recombinase